MLTCPDWFTAVDRERIQEAMDAADAPAVETTGRLNYGIRAPFTIHHCRYASDTAAVQSVLHVGQVVVQVLARHQDRSGEWRTAADQLFADLIRWANPSRPAGGLSLDAFESAVHDARNLQPWWSSLLTTPAWPTTATKTARRPRRVAGTCPRQAAWLRQHLDLNPKDIITPHRLEQHGGPDGKTTKRFLAGYGADDDVRQKLLTALRDLGRTVTIDDIPHD